MIGIFPEMSFEEYLAAPGINQSALKDMARSPEHFFDKHLAPDRDEKESSKSQRRGHLVHAAVYEPAKFAELYASELNKADYPDAIETIDDLKAELVALNVDFKKSAKKQELIDTLLSVAPDLSGQIWDRIKAEHERQAQGKEIISLQHYQCAAALQERLKAHPTAQLLRAEGKPEVSIFWIDEETGEQCKARIDWLGSRWLIDTKTTEDAREENFMRSIIKYGYDFQAAWYLDGWMQASGSFKMAEAYIFEVVESTRPFGVRYYYADQVMIEKGRMEYRRLLDQYAECKSTSVWPGYKQEIEKITLPAWALKESREINF